MSPRRVDSEARRAEILGAAVRVFARKGFAASRIEDVAIEAGIAKGSVYLAFDSREALLRAAFDEFAERSATGLHRASNGHEPALDRLEHLIRAMLSMLTSEPELSRILLDLWTVGRDGGSGMPLDIAGVYARYRSTIATLLAEAATDGALRAELGESYATVVVGVVEGCLLQWLIDPALPVSDLADTIIDVCFNGLRSQEKS
ncbi:TetR/AcrR family transcriptional regulator [Nocardia sp. CNY236]|uniref:TetR/AcrR family transcriptional regulator n=1 Tax=Nocardia sp. CNY236 TaxID=1169152 RepID=UPI00040EE766|nr:TetR/AcrR family transcriptional regulator [Nocardia sp. CNY236]